jgi:predicted esterase
MGVVSAIAPGVKVGFSDSVSLPLEVNAQRQDSGTAADPHAGQPVLTAGPVPEQAKATLVLVHGRGGTAQDILSLHGELGFDDIAALAPQAAGYTWYPHSFLAPIDSNQPYLDSALRRLSSIVDDLLGRIPSDRIALLGFSQGACLTSEFVARSPRRYGAVMVLTGGLIGPPGTPRNDPGSLGATPVFLGCGDPDPHVPFGRVLETEQVFSRMGATVEVRRYPGRPHTISQDELDACRTLLRRLVDSTDINAR